MEEIKPNAGQFYSYQWCYVNTDCQGSEESLYLRGTDYEGIHYKECSEGSVSEESNTCGCLGYD